MKLIIDISKDRYDEIMAMDWKNCRRFFDEEIRAIHDGKALEQEPCEELDFVQPHKKVSVNLEVCKMREATQKEREGVERYIDSIAEPCEDAISRQTVDDAIHGKCNQCKYYEGIHNVQGHAPCSYHKIGGVMWDWYCSQFEKEDKE